MKFTATFQRNFDVDIDAETPEIAAYLARQVQAQFPVGQAKLLSIVPEGAQAIAGRAIDASVERDPKAA